MLELHVKALLSVKSGVVTLMLSSNQGGKVSLIPALCTISAEVFMLKDNSHSAVYWC